MPLIRSPLADWIEPMPAGTIVVLEYPDDQPDWIAMVMPREPRRNSDLPSWPSRLRPIGREDREVIRAWVVEHGITPTFRATGGAYALIPDNPEEAMAIQMRWR